MIYGNCSKENPLKKFVILILSLLIATVSVTAQEAKVSVGLNGTVDVTNLYGTFSGSSGTQSATFVGVNAYVDLIYGVVSIGYAAQAGSPVFSGGLVNLPSVNQHTGYLVLRAVGKIPIQIAGGFVLFPLLGIEGDIMVTNDQLQVFTASNNNNNAFIVAGLGADLDLGPLFYLRLSTDFDLNLTALSAVNSSGFPNSGFKFNGAVGLGIKL